MEGIPIGQEDEALAEAYEKLQKENLSVEEVERRFRERSGMDMPDPDVVEGAIDALRDVTNEYLEQVRKLFHTYQKEYTTIGVSIVLGIYIPLLSVSQLTAECVIGNTCKRTLGHLSKDIGLDKE